MSINPLAYFTMKMSLLHLLFFEYFLGFISRPEDVRWPMPEELAPVDQGPSGHWWHWAGLDRYFWTLRRYVFCVPQFSAIPDRSYDDWGQSRLHPFMPQEMLFAMIGRTATVPTTDNLRGKARKTGRFSTLHEKRHGINLTGTRVDFDFWPGPTTFFGWFLCHHTTKSVLLLPTCSDSWSWIYAPWRRRGGSNE